MFPEVEGFIELVIRRLEEEIFELKCARRQQDGAQVMQLPCGGMSAPAGPRQRPGRQSRPCSQHYLVVTCGLIICLMVLRAPCLVLLP